jgi:flagellar basal body L-ring protein FlgH
MSSQFGLLNLNPIGIFTMAKSTSAVAARSENVATRKKECPITKAAFFEAAKAITANLGGSPIAVMPKEFSTGSFGWNASGKIPVEVGGTVVQVQLSVNLIVVGSKEVG